MTSHRRAAQEFPAVAGNGLPRRARRSKARSRRPARRGRRALGVELLETRLTLSAGLILATEGGVVGAGTLGDQSWTAGEAVQFADPQLDLEPGTTSGTFSRLFNLNDFTSESVTIGALHVVQDDISIAGDTLREGSVLFSVSTAVTLDGLAVTRRDVVCFTPETADNYHAGTFRILIDGSEIAVTGQIDALSLAAADVVVGGKTLAAGTFLLAGSGVHTGMQSNDVIFFEPTSLGPSNTDGSVKLLLDGNSIDLSKAIGGIHLVSQATMIGGTALDAGDLLIGLLGDDPSVGNNGIAVAAQDVFVLDVTGTGDDTAATASAWFQGSDVHLTTADAGIAGISLIETTPVNSPPTTVGIEDVVVASGAPATVLDVFAAFDDAEDADEDLTYEITANSTPSLFSAVAIDGQAGTLSLEYAAGEVGVSQITLRATDRAGAFVETTFQVTIEAAVPPPDDPDTPPPEDPGVPPPDEPDTPPPETPDTPPPATPDPSAVLPDTQPDETPAEVNDGRPGPMPPPAEGISAATHDAVFLEAGLTLSHDSSGGGSGASSDTQAAEVPGAAEGTSGGVPAENAAGGTQAISADTDEKSPPPSPGAPEARVAQRTPPAAPAPQARPNRLATPELVDAALRSGGERLAPEPLTGLFRELDHLDGKTKEEIHRAAVETLVATGITASLAAGYVIWSLPRASLLWSALASSPIWRDWDPLSVLDAYARKRKRPRWRPDSSETLETIVR